MTPEDRGEKQDRDREPEALTGPDVVATTDPVVNQADGERLEPDQTIVAETTGINQTRGVVEQPIRPTPASPGKANSPDAAKREAPQPADHAKRPAWIGYMITGVVALACGVGITLAVMSSSTSSKDQDQSRQDKKGDDSSIKGDSPESQPKSQAVTNSGGKSDASLGDGDTSKDQMERLSARFDILQRRVEAILTPRDINSPDLASLRLRMDELARSIEDVRRQPDRQRQLEQRLERMQADMQGFRDQIAAEKERSAHAASPTAVPPPPPPASSIPVPPDNAKATDEAMAAGVALFKKAKYAEAEAIFRGLQQSRAEDARIWYYSALANGLATGQWDGEARTFVVQGSERERAGLPPASAIDTAFADLNAATGKNWLAAYRAQLVK